MVNGVIVFDMDGVLVEVGESYRETIVQTVQHFSGKTISRDLIQDYKNAGGWNNDWLLSERILLDQGVEVAYNDIVDQFNRIFLGHDGTPGLIQRERWFDTTGVLERLGARYRLGIFTGRLRYEADITLDRFAKHLTFDPMICADNVEHPKPHPEGLQKVQALYPGANNWSLGDTVDDARSARAAGVPFIGVVSPEHSRRAEVLDLFGQERAIAVIDDINQLESVFE
jgi:HAD superfamily hydrolase (TIGR01548 family)